MPPLLRLREDTKYDHYPASGRVQEAFAFQLPTSGDHNLGAVTELRVDHYYRVPASNFPAINSLSFVHPLDSSPTLLVFQVRRNNDTRDVITGDLDKMNRLHPPGAHAHHVVVTPNGVTPRIVV